MARVVLMVRQGLPVQRVGWVRLALPEWDCRALQALQGPLVVLALPALLAWGLLALRALQALIARFLALLAPQGLRGRG